MSVYCSAPWNGITVREDGKVRTCCNGRKTVLDLNTQSIQDLESSSVLKSIKEKMLLHLTDEENCSSCVEIEKNNGVSSLRQHYNIFYPEIDIDSVRPRFLDIRWNNICNLACLYCSPTFSSKWVERLDAKDKKLIPIRSYQDDLLDWILDRAHDVKEIMLVGGEPMLMKQNYQLFKKLPKDCRISIITNLSYDLENLPCISDLLDRPKECIIWNVSAENTHEKLEYVRSGLEWEKFSSNLDFIEKHWPGQNSFNMVYNLFSAFEIDQTVQYYTDRGMKKFNLLGLGENKILQVGFLPYALRKIATEKLENAQRIHNHSVHIEDRDKFHFMSVDKILTRLRSQDEDTCITWKEFKKGIEWYDKWGTNKFETLWSDLYQLLEQHLP